MKRNPSLHTRIAEVIFLAALMISSIGLFSALAVAQTVAIMPLGDSITDGAAGSTDDTGYRRSLYLQLTGAGRDVAFVGGLTSGIPLDFDRDHEGHSGWRADQIRDNIYNWLVANPAEIVLLHIGTNDISGSNQNVQEVADILENIDQYELDNTTSVKVLLARIILRGDSLNPQTIAFNDAVEAMALQRIGAGDDIVLVDQENALTYPADLADTVHPNDSGYGQMADAWFAVLDPILASTGSVAVGSVALAASSPGNLTSDDLTCTYTLLGDATTAATAWIRNGTPEMAFYLPMEGGEPSALLDHSGHAIAASKIDNPTWNAGAGHDGFGAYEFDGNDGLIAGEVFPTNSSYTKCAWVYRTGSGDNGGNNIMSCDEDAGGHAFWAPDARSNHLTAGHTGPSWVGVEDAVPLALNTWYYVAVTYDDASDLMILYKDGVEVDRATVPAVVTDPSLFVGTFGTHGWRWMGTIDDPRVYAHALAPEQIAALFSTGRDLCVAPETVVGDQWQARVTPFSASESGPTVSSNTITILSGSAPAVENLSLVSASGNDLPTDDLICSYGLTGSATTAATAWTRNGAPLMTLYLPCEGGAATALLDYSGNGYGGVMGNDVTWTATGGHDLNGAFIFGGGSDSQIDMGTVMPAGAYTKCAWVKRQAGAVSYNIISGDNSHAFWAPDNTGYRLAAGHNAGWDNRVVDTGDPLAVDTWYFVAVTFDPAVGAGQMILYKNGSVADSATNVPTHSDDGGRVWIGAFNDASAWAGTIDDPRIYPFALSPDQLLEIYTSGNDRISALETSGGEQWQAQVTAFSATEAGATAPTNTLTIQSNTTVANVSLTSTSGSDLTTDDLTVGFDLGGDATTAATAWTRNGAPLMTMYYPFEGGSSRALNDYSGSGHNGIASGDPDALASGGHDGLGCVYLDGNDAIDAGQCLPTGAYTKSAWVRVAAPITANRNILSGHTDHAMWVANYNGGYRLTAGHNHAWNQVEDPVPFVADAWTFVAVTYDPAVGGGTLVLYKDGTEVDSSTGVPLIDNNDTRAYVGVYGATTLYMQGHIDDARIFDRALSADQIAALYSGGQTIVAAETGGGEQWQAQVTPFSAGDSGATVPSNTVTIQATVAVANVSLISTSGIDLTTDDLTVSYDLVGDATTAAAAWSRNGVPLMTLYLPCEGGPTNALLDYSGNGFGGIPGTGTTWSATGGHDLFGAFAFDGTVNAEIDLGNVMPAGAYTKCAWVKRQAGAADYNIISGDVSHAFWAPGGTGFRLAAGHNNGWDNKVIDTGDPLAEDTWYFVAVTFDPAVAGGEMILYKDGNVADSAAGVPTHADDGRRVWVGAFNGNSNWAGTIDDARVYPHALSAAQILELYTTGINRIDASETVAGDEWQAQVTAFSAAEAGVPVASNPLTIQSAAEVTNVGLVSTSGNDYVTDDLTVSYDLSPSASTAATAWTSNGTPLMTMYYPFEGGNGNAITDYSGSGNHGVFGGDPVWLASAGHDGQGCLELDGNDHVDAGNCKPTGAYSKSAWVYWVEDATTSNNIISGQSNHAFWIADYGGKRLAAGHNGAWDQVQDPALFGAGVWTHVAVTYDPAVDGGTLTLYKNGSAVDASIGIPASSDTRVYIGSYAANYHFQGRIDDPRIYDRALAPDQVNALYTDGNTIVAAETGAGDLWQAQITPFSAVEAGPTVASNTLTIVAPLIPPTITSTAVTTATVDRLYVYDVEAAGYPVPEYAFSGSPPAGMTIDPVTGLIQWMPTAAQVGPQAVEVVASNTEGTDTQAFSVEVAEAPTCPPGMIAYWQLDETGGTNYADSYGTHLAATSLPPTPVTGQVGGAQQFDGSGSTGTNEIRVPAHGDFDWGAGDSFSIEFWLKLAAIPTQNDVIVGRDHDGVGNSLHWWTGVQANTGRASWNQIATSGDGTAVTGATNVADGLWHHLAFVRVAGDGNYIYLDGVQDGYAPKASYNAGFDSPTAEINIGWLWIDKKYTYDGSVDEVALYGRALDPGEIGFHHSRGLAGSGYCTASAAPPVVLADLAATQVLSGSPPGGTNSTTAIRLNWTAPADPSAATVEIYRMGFGFYPEYDDGGGSVPTSPAAPGAGGWEHVASLPAGTGEAFDAPASRDFWYYVGYVTDWYGLISDVSPLTSGTLDYFLGDMSDGEDPPGEGNNIVGMDDISLLGTCYGTDDLDPLFKNVADVGPTSDFSVHDRPQTDNLISFDDLIICAVNFGSGLPKQPGQPMEPPAPAERDLLTLQVPPLPDVEQTFAVRLVMSGAGQIQGLSIPLQWNPEVVAPVGVASGPLLQDQGGASTILSPRPGVLDVVLLGARDQGISGEGLLATATFRVLAEGDPQLVLAEISARDQANEAVVVQTQVASGVPDAETVPRMTTLHANVPNPFNPRTTIAFDLAETGRATVKIYGVDGRLVKTLADSEFRPGRYTRIWDGTDESGRGVASGVYLVRLQTPDWTHLRRMLLLR